MTVALDSLYQQIILDHYKHPQHRHLVEPFDAEVHHVNPTCGDEVTLRLRLEDGRIADVGWVGEGCSISQASTSVMSVLVVGEPITKALELSDRFLELMHSRGDERLSAADAESLDDAVAFAGVSKYPARVKCALLGWMAMKGALANAHARADATTENTTAENTTAENTTAENATAENTTVENTAVENTAVEKAVVDNTGNTGESR